MKPHFVVFKSDGKDLEAFNHIFSAREEAESMAKFLALQSGKEHIVFTVGNVVYRCTMPEGKPTIFRRPDSDNSKKSLKLTDAIAQARKDQKVIEEQEKEFKRKQRRGWYLAHKEAENKRQKAKRDKQKTKIQQNDLDNNIEAHDNSLVNQQQEDKGRSHETGTHNTTASGEGRSGS